jgi:hypothetical protein
MAGATGLEPAASGVTGRRSNQLSYAPAGGGDLNAAPQQVKVRPKTPALALMQGEKPPQNSTTPPRNPQLIASNP